MNIDATFWVAVSFFIFVGGLFYLKVPQKINEAMNNKINENKSEIEEAEKLKDEAKNLLSDYENKLNQVAKETALMIDAAKKESDKNLIVVTEKFYQIIDNKKKNLNQKINQMKEDAIKETKSIAIKISIEAVKKIMTTSVDQKKLEPLYNEGLNHAKIVLKKSTT